MLTVVGLGRGMVVVDAYYAPIGSCMFAGGDGMKRIDEWWPMLHEEVRRALVNGIWMPVSAFARAEIERLGGPGADGDYWKTEGGYYRLPQAAVQWIIKSPDFKRFLEPVRPDPRAAYFRGTWPQRRR